MMFARNVQFNLKNGKNDEFARTLHSDVLPLLKKQKGFKEELTLLNGAHCMAISVWDDRPSADSYQTNTYPQVLQKLSTFIEGTPRVETYDVPLTTAVV